MRDLNHAFRLLSRSPAFTLVAVVSLALGIGANTAIFTLLDQLMLRRLPVAHPEQLQMIWTTGPILGSNQGSRASSYPMYQDFQQRAPAFSYVFCRYYTPLSISLGNQTERVTGELVSGNYFQALGIKPALGRVFSPEEDDRVYKGHPSVVLSYPYWVTRFGADAGVIGQKILVNNYPMVIVGVSAAGFSGFDPASSPQIRIPILMKPLMTPGSDNLSDRRRQWVQIFARRKPGYTMESAQASLQPLLSGILRDELESSALRDVSKRDRDQFLARKVLTESVANGYSYSRRRDSAVLSDADVYGRRGAAHCMLQRGESADCARGRAAERTRHAIGDWRIARTASEAVVDGERRAFRDGWSAGPAPCCDNGAGITSLPAF